MAEFCVDCWNKMNETNHSKSKYVQEWGLCEGCGEWKKVVCGVRWNFHSPRYILMFLLYDILCWIGSTLFRLIKRLLKKENQRYIK